MRLRYTAASPYAHLNRAAFPWDYPDREAAERVRALCVRPEWVEIVEGDSALEIRGNDVCAWDNVASPQGASTPAGSNHRSILETNGG